MLTVTRWSSALVANGERERWDTATYCPRLVETDGAADVVEPGQAQPDLQTDPHHLLERLIEHADVGDRRAQDSDVAHQAERLLDGREANFEPLVGELNAH